MLTLGLLLVSSQGTSPDRILVNVTVSIFPPETTHTIFPAPALPERAAATDAAPAPSATTRFRSTSRQTASAISLSEDVMLPWTNGLTILNISERTLFPPIPSTKLGTRFTSIALPSRRDAARGEAVSGSTA